MKRAAVLRGTEGVLGEENGGVPLDQVVGSRMTGRFDSHVLTKLTHHCRLEVINRMYGSVRYLMGRLSA
jgi:hypothetical protein